MKERSPCNLLEIINVHKCWFLVVFLLLLFIQPSTFIILMILIKHLGLHWKKEYVVSEIKKKLH